VSNARVINLQPNVLDRLPPHSLEAEQGVLGCCLISPNECIGQAVEALKRGEAEFYDMRHQVLYSHLVAMWDAQQPIDLISFQQRLKDAGQLEGVGGLAYLSELDGKVPSVANLGYYLSILKEKSTLRHLLQAAVGIVGKVYEASGPIDALVDEAEREILKVGEDSGAGEIELTQKEHVRAAIDAIQQRFGGNMTGLPTGIRSLDKLTGGLQPSDMIVIGARPSCGKTSLAVQIGMVAAESGCGVGIFSLEMTASMLNQRALGTIARVNVQKGHWFEADMRAVSIAATKLSKLPLYIDDRSGLKMAQIKAKARRWHKKHGIRLLIIDYLTLIRPRLDKADRQASVAEISNDIKGLAKELKVPVIALAQLNRDIEKGKERKPTLSDLRESGQIEQDADVICFLYKEDPNHEPSDVVVQVNLLVAKQRNGGLDEIRLSFHRETTRFEEGSPIED
jgi:replicative DNA helicase